MNLGSGELIVAAFVLFAGIVPIVLLAFSGMDIARRPDWQWSEAEQSQGLWMAVILLICCIGPVVYLAVARPKLNAAEAVGPPSSTA